MALYEISLVSLLSVSFLDSFCFYPVPLLRITIFRQ
jgi:hypothetical protein